MPTVTPPQAGASSRPVMDFSDYVAAHWASWHRFAYSVTRDAEDAKDSVQDALTSCYRRWEQICAGNPDAYLRRSIVNAHIDRWRGAGRAQATDDIDSFARPVSDGTDALADADLALRLCDRLPPRQRAAVVLRYLEDRDYDEIADICGVTQATARSLVRHALTALKSQLTVRNDNA